MKAGIQVLLFLLLTGSFAQIAQGTGQGHHAPSTDVTRNQGSTTQMQVLQKALSSAKNRVVELEAELREAQITIERLERDKAGQLAESGHETGSTQAVKAVTQTTRGLPVYDTNNPQKPVKQKDVIAKKFTPRNQSEPIATTRLLADDIERSGIRHLDRVADQVPNMQYGQSGNEARISIRGTRTNRTGAEADQVVAIFEDGVSVPTTTQAMGPYVDIDTIEILRGPQGVRYGRNAFGGVINIISNQPDPSGWDFSLEGTIGYADGTRFEAMLNMPLTDTVVTRIAARSDVHSGYIDNHILEGDSDDLHDRKQQFVRWMTRWQPTDRFSLQLNLASFDQNQTGSGIWGYQQIGAYVDGQYLPGHQFAPNGVDSDRGPWNVSRNLASLEDQENLSGTLKMNWDIGFATLEGYLNGSKFENQQIFDSDYSAGGDPVNSDFNGWDSFRDTTSAELRLKSSGTGLFDWQAGVHMFDMESDWGWLETRNGNYVQPDWDSTGNYKTDSISAFFSAGFRATDHLRIAGGLRWYEDSKQLRTGLKDSWNGVLWNAAIEYDFNENIHTYLTASTGYKPGGVNESPGVPTAYGSEHVTAFELGLKDTLLDGQLVLNMSAFYNDYTDLQAQSFTILPLPGTAGLMDYMNTAGDMESKGLEAEIQWLPGSRWNISANLAWLDAKFTDYSVPSLAGLGYIEGHTVADRLSLDGWRTSAVTQVVIRTAGKLYLQYEPLGNAHTDASDKLCQ